MKDIILQYLDSFWILLTSIAPYILVGIFLAAVMKQLIDNEWVKRRLGGDNISSLIRSILLGIPLPLCSCSVIPFATTLYKSGASKASTLGFLISTPITGIDSIIATYGVFGWFFTLYRVVVSTIVAFVAGILSMVFDKTQEKEISKSSFSIQNNTNSFTLSTQKANKSITFTTNRVAPKKEKKKFDIFKLYDDALYSIFKDFAKALMVGIAIGAMLTTFIPQDISIWLKENIWLNYIIILVISSALYICATSSIPLGVAMLGVGFSPGAVFILLTAGPATSIITMSVVLSLMGRKSLFIYLLSVLSISLISGYLLDLLFASYIPISEITQKSTQEIGFIANISAIILLYLTYKALIPKKSSCCGSSCGCS